MENKDRIGEDGCQSKDRKGCFSSIRKKRGLRFIVQHGDHS